MLIGQQLEFQFFDLGPWSLYNIQTERKHTVNYKRPFYIELGVNVESYEETIKRCLQSIASYPFRVTPNVDFCSLPTLMGNHRLPSSFMSGVRCNCFLPHLKASSSPDVQAFLHHVAFFEIETSQVLEGIPPPKKRIPRSLTGNYNAVADAVLFQEGMMLPCQTEKELGESYGVCLLLKNLGSSHFLCHVLLNRPILLRPGFKLIRKVTYKEPRSLRSLDFVSDVAIIEEIF